MRSWGGTEENGWGWVGLRDGWGRNKSGNNFIYVFSQPLFDLMHRLTHQMRTTLPATWSCCFSSAWSGPSAARLMRMAARRLTTWFVKLKAPSPTRTLSMSTTWTPRTRPGSTGRTSWKEAGCTTRRKWRLCHWCCSGRVVVVVGGWGVLMSLLRT